MNLQSLKLFVDSLWEAEVIPELIEYIRIPAKSPAYDPEWESNGFIEEAMEHLAKWARPHIAGLSGSVNIIRLAGRTPVMVIDVPGQSNDTVLLYGHLDKQPEMEGWSAGLGPWRAVVKDEKLYGRGGADDGYAAYASISALLALGAQRIKYARCILLIEACEESGSFDLPFYIAELSGVIGLPSLVIALDSNCGNYDQLWVTTSLRGLVNGVLTVDVLQHGVHSGDASGIVPDSFRIARSLLSRIEDETTGDIKGSCFHVSLPPQRKDEAAIAANALGETIWKRFPVAATTTPISDSLSDLILNATWRPSLTVIGASGLPNPADAGSVLRPNTTLSLSMRLPPTADSHACSKALTVALTAGPPYDAHVDFRLQEVSPGWHAGSFAPWLQRAVENASRQMFGREPAYLGDGGAIPFVPMLAAHFPEAQFLITGLLGPQSNAHAVDECLHLPAARRLTAAIAIIIEHHAGRLNSGNATD